MIGRLRSLARYLLVWTTMFTVFAGVSAVATGAIFLASVFFDLPIPIFTGLPADHWKRVELDAGVLGTALAELAACGVHSPTIDDALADFPNAASIRARIFWDRGLSTEQKTDARNAVLAAYVADRQTAVDLVAASPALCGNDLDFARLLLSPSDTEWKWVRSLFGLFG